MRIAIFLFKLLIFLLPLQLAFHFWPSWSFVYGIRIDYLSPTFYITDCLVALLFIVSLFDSSLRKKLLAPFRRKHFLIISLSILIYFLLVSLTAALPLLSLFKLLKILEYLFVALLSFTLFSSISSSLLPILAISTIWLFLLALSQVIVGGSIGGTFYYLGERSFRMSFPGIARAFYFGSEHLRPYATFPHPNALAGFAGVTLLLLLVHKRKIIHWLGIVASIGILLLTVSHNAWFSLVFTLPFFMQSVRSRFLPFFLPILVALSLLMVYESGHILQKNILTSESSIQRLELLAMSGVYVAGYPLKGIGVGHFIALLPQVREFTSSFLDRQFSWWLQPVHNIYILILVETGFVGLLSVSLGVQRILIKTKETLFIIPFIFILLTGLWDHYWLTLQQPSLLLAILTGLLLKDGTIQKHDRRHNK